MTLRLLSDPWIPAIKGGEAVMIRPDQIAEPGITGPAWQRPDFNLACIELLVGLVSMADPPEDEAAWNSRFDEPDARRLREALAPFDAYFALGGDGPRFLQDLEAFEQAAKPADIKPVDMLYIDAAGDSTASKNADLMVKRNRYASLSLPDAAMALYTLQTFAPAGGAGNRTSMRGGGPMTTLVQPVDVQAGQLTLWRLVFANVLPGSPLPARDAGKALPWLRPTRTSEKGQTVSPTDAHPLEAFFGMPRRLRLVFGNGRAVGVVQRPYGTNYAAWEHPLTPYYRRKEEDPEWFAVHPKAGRLSYRNWLGITMEPGQERKGTRRTARAVHECRSRHSSPDFELMVGGWAMDNMKPMSFSLDQYPWFPSLGENGEDRVHQLVEAANIASGALRKALKGACQIEGASSDRVTEAFFADTEEEFISSVRRITDGAGAQAEVAWHRTLRDEAVRTFDGLVLGGLTDHGIAEVEKRIIAKRNLLGALAKRVRKAMNLPMPGKKEKQA